MKHQEGFFKNIRDTRIYSQSWLPDGEPKAKLLLVHGLAEHSGRYMNLVDHFVPLGYSVHAFDHPGHGKSDGTRAYVERFENYTETLKTYFDRMRPGKPVFLIGHSMGGLISALYLLDHQRELTGAVLSGPAVKAPGKITLPILMISKLLSALVPRFGSLRLEAEGICRDPAVVEAYVSDPLVHRGKITARLTAEMLTAMRLIRAEAGKINLPVLIVQGSADRLVDPSGARVLYDAVSSTDKKIRIYEGFYHEVFNEPGYESVLRDVERWIEEHLGS